MGDRINVMLDLETMGLSMNSAIIQIGAVTFDLKHRFFCNVALQSALMAGMTLDPKTLAWWQAQGEIARMTLVTQPVLSLHRALDDFGSWFHDLPGEEHPNIWSHGAAFDIPLLGQAYDLCSMACPWAYRDVRDTRTVYAMAEERGWKPTKQAESLKHNAINDCLNQISNLKSAWAWLDSDRHSRHGTTTFIPVQDAEPANVAGRTGGAHPPTGANSSDHTTDVTLAELTKWVANEESRWDGAKAFARALLDAFTVGKRLSDKQGER